MSDSVKYFREHLGLDGLTHHDDVKFLFLLEHSMWACPWSVWAREGAVNTLGPMADGDSAVPAWLRWDSSHLGRPTSENSSVGGVPVSLNKLLMPFCSN